MLTVYGMKLSGNCYKVQLALEQLGLPYRWVEVNSAAGETRTAEYLRMNPNGKVPLLEVTEGQYLAESNAILCYLADGSALLPSNRWQRAQLMQWLFFEQYSHEPYIAVARFIANWLPSDHPRQAELPRLRERGRQALAVMEQQLSLQAFIAGADYSIGDIALFAYTHVATDGGFDMSVYPNIQRWLSRVRAQPGFGELGK